MSKFRSRQLDASKPIAIYFQEDISDSSEFNNVTNRSVPQLPTGMEKEEETEHHLQQAIFHHRVIPVPEVYNAESQEGKISYQQLYPENFKAPRQLIHIHPFSSDQDIPDYDLDSEDEEWLQEHARKGELLPLLSNQFEEMMDRLEKASGLKAITLQEAKLLLKDDDDLITAVYDYWLNKRLVLEHPLIPQVKSEKGVGCAPTDPYVAFRKRTEKMQTRKNRKNDESSYEKMLKLRRDLAKAMALVDMVRRREKAKKELLHLNVQIHEKRYEMEDFSGAILNELLNQRVQRSAFTPLMPNHHLSGISLSELDDLDGDSLSATPWLKVPSSMRQKNKRREDGRRERKPYKKKKRSQHMSSPSSLGSHLQRSYTHPSDPYSLTSSYQVAEEDVSLSEAEDETSVDGYFAFRRNALVSYLPPEDPLTLRVDDNPQSEFYLTSLEHPSRRFIGLARRRVGRGGRLLLDRRNYIPPSETMDIKSDIKNTGLSSNENYIDALYDLKNERRHFHPNVTISTDSSDSEGADVDVETVCGISSPVRDIEVDSSTFYVMAEVLEGSNEGTLTQLLVTTPPNEDLDFLTNSVAGTSFLLEENSFEDIDFLAPESGAGVSVCSENRVNESVGSPSEILTSGGASLLCSNVDSESHLGDKDGCGENIVSSSSSSRCANKSPSTVRKSSLTVNSLHKHSSLDFQTQPSSKFSTLDTHHSANDSPCVNKQLSQLSSTAGDDFEKLGITPLSNCTSSMMSSSLQCGKGAAADSSVTSPPRNAFSTASVVLSSPSPSVTTLSLSPLLSKPISVSSSKATSLNSLLCASSKKNCENSSNSAAELNAKKLLNLSSIYIRQPKDSSSLDSLQVPSGFLLSNHKSNASSILNSSSNIMSQKLLSSWANDDSAALTNGPGSKTLDSLKCTKVAAPILFHET